MELAHAPIRKMEPLIIDRLRLAFPAKDFAIERVPQVLTIKEFQRLASASPFIGLAWTGMKPDGASGRQLKGQMQWRLIMIFKASSSLETRFKGDAKGLGLDAMIDVAVALLQGADFPGVGHSEVTLANSVYADGWGDDNIVIAQVDFQIQFTVSVAAFELKTLDDLLRLGITWAVSADEDADTVSETVNVPQG